MVAPTTRENISAMLVVITLLGLAAASAYHHRSQIEVSPGTTLDQAIHPTPSYSPSVIPTSSAGAQAYLNQASSAAADGHYDQAAQILTQAHAAYPDDQNISLSLGYYQNLARQHGQ